MLRSLCHVLALFLLTANLSAAPNIEIEPLSPDRVKLFVSSVYSGIPLNVPSIESEHYENSADYEAWRGQTLHFESDINKITLEFVNSGEAKPGKRDKFSIELTLSSLQTMIKSDAALNPQYSGGALLEVGPKVASRRYLEGLDDTGLVLAVPPFSGDNVRGIMLCPQTISRGFIKNPPPGHYGAILRESNFRVSLAHFEVSGLAEGRALTGLGVGRADATISTTSNLAPSKESKDHTFDKDVAIRLEYLPRYKEVQEAKSKNLKGAIELVLQFHKPSGFKKKAVHRHSAWIEELTLEKPLELTINQKKMKVDAGSTCYLVYKERQTVNFYTRQELILPERFKE